MKSPVHDEDDQGEVFLDESDIIHEVTIDDEDLPDIDDDEAGSDPENSEQPDDSEHIFTGHSGELYTVACSPTDATLVATGGGDDRGFLWRINQGDWASEIQGHKDSVSSLAFSTDGQLLASGGFDGLVQVWDTSSGDCKCALEGPGGGIEWVSWHPRGHVLLAGSEDSAVWMWNADRGAYLNMFSGHGSSVTCGDFTPDGKTICTGSDDATLRIWNPKSGENIHVIRGHPYHTEGLTCLTISADSTLALTGSKDGSVHMVNITTGKVVSSLVSHTDSIECVGFSPRVISEDSDGVISDFNEQYSMDADNGLGLLALVASGVSRAPLGLQQEAWIRNLLSGICNIRHPRCSFDHEDGVTCLTWLGTSRYLVTGCVDGKVRVWDSLSSDCVRTFSGHTDAIQALSVSANQDFLVSVSLDGTARVFEIAEFR
ncbi:angio-associated migratory cell protein [Melia azedarach]|uniref:Angio-associated migratory cell protein n=1 Tax=Melia azedarach TaxID=155640 RepID=A0ACC1WQQ6_MELAZ|nr:angio-associated migratory cell protein [Melia azedarach]